MEALPTKPSVTSRGGLFLELPRGWALSPSWKSIPHMDGIHKCLFHSGAWRRRKPETAGKYQAESAERAHKSSVRQHLLILSELPWMLRVFETSA